MEREPTESNFLRMEKGTGTHIQVTELDLQSRRSSKNSFACTDQY